MSDTLRARLQEITDSGQEWPHKIAALHSEYAHSIRVVCPALPGKYNCFAFALGLHESKKYLLVAQKSKPNVFANSAFVSYLISEKILRPIDCTAPGQKVIIYCVDGVPKHAGIISKQRVISKWGPGQFFEHEIFEVPLKYGTETACYYCSSISEVESGFLQYAEQQGVRLDQLRS